MICVAAVTGAEFILAGAKGLGINNMHGGITGQRDAGNRVPCTSEKLLEGDVAGDTGGRRGQRGKQGNALLEVGGIASRQCGAGGIEDLARIFCRVARRVTTTADAGAVDHVLWRVGGNRHRQGNGGIAAARCQHICTLAGHGGRVACPAIATDRHDGHGGGQTVRYDHRADVVGIAGADVAYFQGVLGVALTLIEVANMGLLNTQLRWRYNRDHKAFAGLPLHAVVGAGQGDGDGAVAPLSGSRSDAQVARGASRTDGKIGIWQQRLIA